MLDKVNIQKYGTINNFSGGSLAACPFCGSVVKILDNVMGGRPTIMKRTKCKHFKRTSINAMTGGRVVIFEEKL